MPAKAAQSPNRGLLEQDFLAQGLSIVGIDEVGRGCLAGPVYAAAVTLDYDLVAQLDDKTNSWLRDSKTLSARQRQHMIQVISDIAKEVTIGSATPREIEEWNIAGATGLAMRRAIKALKRKPEVVLVDGRDPIRKYDGRQLPVIKGDRDVLAIAAASIVAKQARDHIMAEMANNYPHYGFERNMGYGTREHLDSIQTHGICPLHRRNFAPINAIYGAAKAREQSPNHSNPS